MPPSTVQPGITFEALPAGYGDALLVTCARPGGDWRLLVDTGPDECWPMLKARLARIPLNETGQRHIDLAVISHIDHDHIGAAQALFNDRSLKLSYGDVWFNAPPRPPMSRGVAEGHSLATLLGAEHTPLPWNRAWRGKNVVTPEDLPFVELPAEPGGPRLTLLSPTPATLASLFKVWARELAKLRLPELPPPVGATREAGPLNVEALAERKTALDHAPANGSSIALLLEHAGASVLLAADAYAPVLVEALEALAAHRGATLPWKVDVFKLSHHGSRANVTADLIRTVRARHYVVSTNGAIFGHPNDEAVARVVKHGGTAATLWFNHANERSARWAAADLSPYGCSVRQPGADDHGTTITVSDQRH